eukprot:6284919-Lingulodinium_polyedra.AAC.1
MVRRAPPAAVAAAVRLAGEAHDPQVVLGVLECAAHSVRAADEALRRVAQEVAGVRVEMRRLEILPDE